MKIEIKKPEWQEEFDRKFKTFLIIKANNPDEVIKEVEGFINKLLEDKDKAMAEQQRINNQVLADKCDELDKLSDSLKEGFVEDLKGLEPKAITASRNRGFTLYKYQEFLEQEIFKLIQKYRGKE